LTASKVAITKMENLKTNNNWISHLFNTQTLNNQKSARRERGEDTENAAMLGLGGGHEINSRRRR